MDLETILGISKVFYLFTIPWLGVVWYKAFRFRQLNDFVGIIFWVQCLLLPMYSLLAIMYVLDISSHSAFTFLGWSIINLLFIATDLLLVNSIIYRQDADQERMDKI